MRSSIGRRLFFSLITSLMLLWLGVLIAVAWVARHETEEIFDSGLQETSQRLLALAVHELKADPGAGLLDTAEPKKHDEYVTYQLFDGDGNLLMRSHAAPAHAYPIPLKVGHYTVDRQHFYVEASKDGRYVLQVAERASHREESFHHLLGFLLLPFAVLLPITALLIYRSTKEAQRSIVAFGRDIAARDSKDLRPLATEDLASELFDLGESINSLMRRLQLALEVERNFTANSAHELRTPIAAALAQLDVLRNEVSDPKSAARVADARNMIERLEKMTVKLLQLAKAESGSAFNLAKLDLNSLTEMLIRDLSFRSQRELNFSRPEAPVWIKGDVDVIAIVIQNLLENADRYASADTPIEIRIDPAGALSVSNDCAAIDAETMQKLRQRFVRADQSKDGSGLGLSIVDTILGQCEAELILKSPCLAHGRGFAAEVSFKSWP